MSKQKNIILVVAIILIAVSFILIINENRKSKNNSQIIGETVSSTIRPIDATDHVLGKSKAPVQVIIYSDFECLFCAQFAETIKKVEEKFKDKIVITFRHYLLPGHPGAEKAAEAAECAAEQNKFWEMYNKLFADNVAISMSEEQFTQDAIDLGLNQEQFNQCLASGKYKNKIEEQIAEGSKAGVTGTPTIFVNGNIYPGAYPFEDFTSSDGQQEKGMNSIISELLNK